MFGPLLRPARGRVAAVMILVGAAVGFLAHGAGHGSGWPFWAGVGLAVTGWVVAATGLAPPPRFVREPACRCGAIARDTKRCLGCGRRA